MEFFLVSLCAICRQWRNQRAKLLTFLEQNIFNNEFKLAARFSAELFLTLAKRLQS